MCLRAVRRKNRDGSTVAYYQLAHNERHPRTGKSVAKVIHKFGRADQLDREALVRLCRFIARVCGVEVIDPAKDEDCEGAGLPKDVKLKRTLEYGTVVAAAALWERLGIGKTIRRLSRSKNVPYDSSWPWSPIGSVSRNRSSASGSGGSTRCTCRSVRI